MEPTDSRLPANQPQNDRADVVFDTPPPDGTQNAVSDEVPRAPQTGLPLDVVPGVEPSAELPLTAPAVHQPLGAISELEAALRNFTSPSAPIPPPPPATTAAPSPPTASATAAIADPLAEPLAQPPLQPLAEPLAQPPLQPLAQPVVHAPPAPDPAVAAASAPSEALAAPEIRVNAVNAVDALSLPVQHERTGAPVSPKARTGTAPPTQFPMLPVRFLAVGGTAMALALSAWQEARVIDGQDRLASLSMLSLLFAVVGAVGIVLWTWVVTENARRLVSPARTQEPPHPFHAAATWLVPMVFIGAASAAVTYLSARLNTPSEGTESSFPLMLGLASMVLALPMMYSPVTYLSGVVRKIGGRGIRFAEWIWVPVALSVVGVAMIAGLRVGGAFGDDFEGLAPSWVIGVAAIVPTVVIVVLGWRAAAAVEADVERAFARRLGVPRPLSKRRSKSFVHSADGGPNHKALNQRGYVSQMPGAHVLGVAISAGLAGLSLLSLVGALVVFLFWQESKDGVLLATQSDRAWDLVALLHTLERNVAFGVLALAVLFSFLAVTNVRMAAARRRNPVLAALAWPAAAGGVWVVGDRFVADGSVVQVIAGFAAQALLLGVPVLLMYRAAGSIGSRRQLLRIGWAGGVVLLVHVQGLGGLSTGNATLDSTQVARLAGYLAIGAALQLLVMFAIGGAMRALTDTTRQVAIRHNALVGQRQQPGAARADEHGPRTGLPATSGAVRK